MATTATSTAEVTSNNTGRVLRPRPATKSSIRGSLNLASVGKALADVMHKDSKDSPGEKEKATKKTKEPISKRGGLVPRQLNEKNAGAISREKSSSPEARTLIKSSRRMSGLPKLTETGTTSSEESSSPATIGQRSRSTVARSNSLRPKTTPASGLPKYRPKSALIEPSSASGKKSSSPVRAGVRRKLSSLDDEKEDKGKPSLKLSTPAEERLKRAISPLPHRGALQVNLSTAINVRPATPEKKGKASTPQSSPSRLRSSPLRSTPTKDKNPSSTAASSSITPTRPASSASSSSSSRVPPSPTTPSATTAQRRTLKTTNNAIKQSKSHKRSPLSGIFSSAQQGLPTTAVRRKVQNQSPTPIRTSSSSSGGAPVPFVFTEGSSLDSLDAHDVEQMLSSIATPNAPTPALPRIQASFLGNEQDPETPTHSRFPIRSNMSLLSATRPANDGSPFLRPRVFTPSTNDRSSILSWEQFSANNRSLGAEEVENMLSVDAPFQAGALSPALTSLMELPESPSLSAMPSPTGYGSISQVLLPDVTPSPAVHNAALRFEEYAAEAPPSYDSGAVTMLRLQLAALESSNTERLMQIEYLEAQLQTAKDARLRDTEELARQISELEDQVQASLRPNEQLTEQIASLEDQLQHAQNAQEQAVQEALRQKEAQAAASRTDDLRIQKVRWETSTAACRASTAWSAVCDTAEGELELVRSSLETLAVLMAGLDQHASAL